jgi:hypothetical protein
MFDSYQPRRHATLFFNGANFLDSLKIGAASKGSPVNEKPSSETPEGMKRYLDLWKEGFSNDS